MGAAKKEIVEIFAKFKRVHGYYYWIKALNCEVNDELIAPILRIVDKLEKGG